LILWIYFAFLDWNYLMRLVSWIAIFYGCDCGPLFFNLSQKLR
jgi:hypothetical protein